MQAESRAALEKTYAAEAGIAGIRVAIVMLNSLVYLFLLDKGGTHPAIANAIIVGANAYGLAVYFLEPYRRVPVLLTSYFTTALDAVFITAWLYATGGYESPFYLLWLVSVTAIAFRFDMRATMVAATVYAASYVGMLALIGEAAGHGAELVVRVAYIFFTGAIGGLLSTEVYAQTREKTSIRDVAERLRESEERFRRLSNATFEGIAIHERGRILECNHAFSRMFGAPPESLVGLTAFDLIDPSSHATIRQRIASPEDTSFEVVARRVDGTTFDVEITARDFPYEGREARVVAIRDITERKRAERTMREREALAVANEKLRELDGIKSKFINNAAHELGTPLTPIKLQAHLLKLGGLGELNEKQRRAVDVLSRNVDHLGLMVKDLLDASRIQSHELRLRREPVELARVLRECAESFPPSPTNATVLCDVEPGLVVEADAARITQVVLNLVGNALKFTPASGTVTVRARRDGPQAVVEVEDTGAGLAPDAIGGLFQPFSQVHDTSATSRSGTGLGLYISKGIVESHGGRIWARSPGLGKGTTFSLTLPLAPAAAPRMS